MIQVLHGRMRTRSIDVDGHCLRIPPGVLDPILFRSGSWLARQLLPTISSNIRLLDMGCGSGVVGVMTQAAGAKVTATDIDPRAVAAARSNGLRDVRQGSLFEPIKKERFDCIAFNPPYFPGRSRGRLYGRALYGGQNFETIKAFSEAVPKHLLPNGTAWMVLSDRAPQASEVLSTKWCLHHQEAVEDEILLLWRFENDQSHLKSGETNGKAIL